MLETTHRLRDHLGFECEEVIDVNVTIDGSWHERGYSSNHGLAAVVSWHTGEALDYHYKPSFMAFDYIVPMPLCQTYVECVCQLSSACLL